MGLFFAFAVVFLHVVEYVLHVVVVLEFFEQFFNRFALFGGDILHVVGNAHEFRADDFISVVFEVLLYGRVVLECAIQCDALFVLVEFVNAIVDEFP